MTSYKTSCGRLHASSLDASGQVWTFLSWGRPFKLSSNILALPEYKPVQVECGWGFSSVLVKSGDVFVWWPFSGEMKNIIDRENEEMDRAGDKKAIASPEGVIPCVTWSIEDNIVRLPSIPTLPPLGEENDEENSTKLVQIAGLEGHIIGLTNKGHVLKIGSADAPPRSPEGSWQYVSST